MQRIISIDVLLAKTLNTCFTIHICNKYIICNFTIFFIIFIRHCVLLFVFFIFLNASSFYVFFSILNRKLLWTGTQCLLLIFLNTILQFSNVHHLYSPWNLRTLNLRVALSLLNFSRSCFMYQSLFVTALVPFV